MWSNALADNWLVVLLAYLAVGIPLNFYLYHDVIDKRWRRVDEVQKFSKRYCALASTTLVLLVAYGFLQFVAGDYKEGGAACLSCAIAVYGLYMRLRQVAILHFFRDYLQQRATSIIDVYQKQETNPRRALLFPDGGYKQGPVNGHISAVFLDDNYPGEGPRVTWLRRKPMVKDWTEMMVRTCLWIRLAVLPSNLAFATLLRPKLTPSGTLEPTSGATPPHGVDTIVPWTLDIVQQQFLASGERRSARGGLEGPLVDYIKCFMGERGTRSILRETLRLAPETEWSQALSEFPSGWIEGLEAKGVAWEVYLTFALHPVIAMRAVDTERTTLPLLMAHLPGELSDWPGLSVHVCGTPRLASINTNDAGVANNLPPGLSNAAKLVRDTLDGDGYVTPAVLMAGFLQSGENTQTWLKSIQQLGEIWHHLAMSLTTGRGLLEDYITKGVDLVVALALLLGADKRSFEFTKSPNTGQGMEHVLMERHRHVLNTLQNKEAEKVLRTSLELRIEGNVGIAIAESRYSLGMFLHDQVRFI